MTLKNEDTSLFGTKVYDFKNKNIALVLKTFDNTYSQNGGGTVDIQFARCVTTKGKLYNVEFDYITPYKELTDEQLIEIGLKKPIKNNTLDDCEKKLLKYWKSQKNYLEELRERWQDEHDYEDTKTYETAIIESAKKKNIEVVGVKLSKDDYSLKITIKLNEKYIGHIDISRIISKTYIEYGVVNLVSDIEKRG